MVQLPGLLFGEVLNLAQLLGLLAGGFYDLGDEVISIHDRAFARLHLAGGKIDHAVRQMVQTIGVGTT